ncbi:hypothetical protein FH972_012741 [Carpinus fangiana]|uniref:Uncharacterized protein n=1 Tax=Carpinus fangiana TaxID=176857 RepID=A0A5N6R6A1_9ROSI|nr:hypothetical protein FH972_012741 [Carpinus fangiana]
MVMASVPVKSRVRPRYGDGRLMLPSASPSSSMKTPSWDLKPRNLSDEMPPSNPDKNVAFYFDDSATLASKLRNHQISGPPKSSQSPSATATATAAMMLQHQLLMSHGITGAGDSRMIPIPLSLEGSDDVVDRSSVFKAPNLVAGAGDSQSFQIFISTGRNKRARGKKKKWGRQEWARGCEIKRRRERERRNESAGLDLRYSRFTNSSSADEKYVRPPRLSPSRDTKSTGRDTVSSLFGTNRYPPPFPAPPLTGWSRESSWEGWNEDALGGCV